MSWVRTGESAWQRPWFHDSGCAKELFWEDGTGTHWWDAPSGDEVIVVADGGWRMTYNGEPYESRYRVFRWFAGRGEVEEQTQLFLHSIPGGGHFDPSGAGHERYATVQHECERAIDGLLGVTTAP